MPSLIEMARLLTLAPRGRAHALATLLAVCLLMVLAGHSFAADGDHGHEWSQCPVCTLLTALILLVVASLILHLGLGRRSRLATASPAPLPSFLRSPYCLRAPPMV